LAGDQVAGGWCDDGRLGAVFGNNWRLLPDRAGHTTPDTYHTVLAVLILCNLVLACRDILVRRRFDNPQVEDGRD
jgi:hypothetical protein